MKSRTRAVQGRHSLESFYECYHCGHEEPGEWSDDEHIYIQVLPNIICPECGT